MTLQIRLVHPQGERLLELPEKTIELPAVVGRAADADVQIPAVSVSRRHCVLFVHQGKWAIADGGSSGGTLVNGQRVTGSVLISENSTPGTDELPTHNRPTLVGFNTISGLYVISRYWQICCIIGAGSATSCS